jgi:hypothetical protein
VSEDLRKPLSRWSERKAAARRGEAPPEPADEARAVEEARAHAAIPEQALPPDAAPADEDVPVLPSIDELNAESDYTVFLKEKVPEHLRRAALRKLWTSDPVLANLDGLNDYDENYNLTQTVIGVVQSAWQAGRGYAEEVEEKIDKVEEALGGSAAAQDEPQPDESQAASEPARASQDGDALGESDAGGENSADAARRVAGAEPDAASD